VISLNRPLLEGGCHLPHWEFAKRGASVANRSVFSLRQLTHFSGKTLSWDWDNCPGWEAGEAGEVGLEAVILGQDYRFSARINAQFGKNIGDVVAHGLLANKERIGNLAVFMAQRQTFEDFLFAVSQLSQ
jgi:hypothetical protein